MKPIEWRDDRVILLDQRKLPCITEYIVCSDYHEVASAIKTLAVRGAPAIGVAAAMGMALAAVEAGSRDALLTRLAEAYRVLGATRPTAVNLFWALDRMLKKAQALDSVEDIRRSLMEEALTIAEEDESMCRKIGDMGAALVPDPAGILTHCNAGSLATAAYGTALGVIRSSFSQGKKIHIFVDETRPLLQGARLTAWELKEEGIPFTLITDSMAGHFMRKGNIQLVVVGADRIARNGDVANKIGTYSVAVLAKEHGIPFYVAAPYSTVDLTIESGDDIHIEERDTEEVTHFAGTLIAPCDISVANPAFDITPHRFITAIITDREIFYPPFNEKLKTLMQI